MWIPVTVLCAATLGFTRCGDAASFVLYEFALPQCPKEASLPTGEVISGAFRLGPYPKRRSVNVPTCPGFTTYGVVHEHPHRGVAPLYIKVTRTPPCGVRVVLPYLSPTGKEPPDEEHRRWAELAVRLLLYGSHSTPALVATDTQLLGSFGDFMGWCSKQQWALRLTSVDENAAKC